MYPTVGAPVFTKKTLIQASFDSFILAAALNIDLKVTQFKLYVFS
jgi:hypothetical protein